MQQRHDRAATTALPPLHPIGYLPEDIYSIDEMSMVRDWLKATMRCRGVEEFEKAAKSWKDESRAEVARILAELREKGFYPSRIGEDGRIAWGIALKGGVQMLGEREAARYEARGRTIMAENGTRFAVDAVAGRLNVAKW